MDQPMQDFMHHAVEPALWCLTGAVFRASFEVVGLDGYQGRTACIVDAVNFWWALMQPLHRALAAR
jgi:hypothetical protein